MSKFEAKKWGLLVVPPSVVVGLLLYFWGIPGVLSLILLAVVIWGWSHITPEVEVWLKEQGSKPKKPSEKKNDWATKPEVKKLEETLASTQKELQDLGLTCKKLQDEIDFLKESKSDRRKK